MNQLNQMTADEAKASLGIATALQQQMMQQQSPQDSTTQETAITDEQPEQVEEDKVSELETKFSEFQKEIKTMIKDEIGGLKEELKNALSEETNEQSSNESTTED